MKPNPSPRPKAALPCENGLILEEFLPYRLSVLMLRISNAIAQSYERQFRLSVPEWRVMAVLGRFGPLPANGVAEKTQMDKVRVSRAVARLVAAGRVNRRIDRADRRRSVLALTPAGESIHREIVPHARRVEARLLAGLTSAERAALDQLIKKLEARATTPFVTEPD
ncbi:MAG TPA: MarR family winged helix-turn-helix transcriptional regulator [Stellaceae bacterium]|nr:MarR family winged helix-turn-helix transcriptional regulator [Stellaceae bacterium]